MSDFLDGLRSVVNAVSNKVDEAYLLVGAVLEDVLDGIDEVEEAAKGFPTIDTEPVQDETDGYDLDDTPEKLALLIEAADRRFTAEGHQWRSAKLNTLANISGVNENFDNLINERDGWTFEHLYGDVAGWGREFDRDEPPF